MRFDLMETEPGLWLLFLTRRLSLEPVPTWRETNSIGHSLDMSSSRGMLPIIAAFLRSQKTGWVPMGCGSRVCRLAFLTSSSVISTIGSRTRNNWQAHRDAGTDYPFDIGATGVAAIYRMKYFPF